MNQEKETAIAVIRPETSISPITVKHMQRNVASFPLLEHELDALGSGQGTFNSTFFGIAFGVFVALAITLSTVEITNPYTHATYWLCFWGSLAASVFFLVRTHSDRRQSRRQIKSIKDEAREGAR